MDLYRQSNQHETSVLEEGRGAGEERGKGGNDDFVSFLPLFAEKGDVFSNSMPITLLSDGGCIRE